MDRGDPVLAAIALARAGLPPLDDPERVARGLSAAEQLLGNGCSPGEPIKACDLDPALLDLRKAGYDPDEPRVPAGSPEGGQWADDGIASGEADYGRSTARPATTAVIDGEGAGLSTSTVPPSGEPLAEGGIVFANYKVVEEPPQDAKVVLPTDGKPIESGDPPTALIAPPYADYRQVYAAGRAIAPLQLLDQLESIHGKQSVGEIELTAIGIAPAVNRSAPAGACRLANRVNLEKLIGHGRCRC